MSLAVWANTALDHWRAQLCLCSCSLSTDLRASTALAFRVQLFGRAWLLFFGGAWLWLSSHSTVMALLHNQQPATVASLLSQNHSAPVGAPILPGTETHTSTMPPSRQSSGTAYWSARLLNELLLETWDIEASYSCCPSSRRQTRWAPIQDILLWTECYSSLVAILGFAHPHHMVDFMAYQRSIVCASSIFEGNAWVVYDRCYRRRAALTKELKTGRSNAPPTITRLLLAGHAPSCDAGTA